MVKLLLTGFSLVLAIWAASSAANDRFSAVELQVESLRGSVHMILGAGGNIGVSAGQDGILIIDDQFAPLAGKIQNSLKSISSTPLKYLINSHHHGDHTGGNSHINHDNSVTILAHHNVRRRLKVAGKKGNHLPVMTYSEGVTFHFNQDTIEVMHLPAGHTDGDSVIMFKKANVLHTGDLFFNGRFPFIDLNSGGSVAGYLANVDTVLSMIDAQTIIIPGHGARATKQDLQDFREMIAVTSDIVRQAKANNSDLKALIEKGLGEQWQPWAWQFISEQRWITTLYTDL